MAGSPGLQLRAGRAEFTNMSAIVRKMREQANPNLRRYADKVGRNGKAIMTARVNQLYDTARPAKRRRSPGTLRLGSGAMFGYRPISYGSSGDAAVQFYIKGGGPAASKFKALNFGSDAHYIGPKKGKGLAFPLDNPGRIIPTRKGDPVDENMFISGRGKPPHGVNHPGTTGSHFFERSIEKARRTTRM